MAIDVQSEKLITATEHARRYDLHIASVYCHMFQGLKGAFLEHIKICANAYTSIEAGQRFSTP
jgi:hypothetical protein